MILISSWSDCAQDKSEWSIESDIAFREWTRMDSSQTRGFMCGLDTETGLFDAHKTASITLSSRMIGQPCLAHPSRCRICAVGRCCRDCWWRCACANWRIRLARSCRGFSLDSLHPHQNRYDSPRTERENSVAKNCSRIIHQRHMSTKAYEDAHLAELKLFRPNGS